MVTAHLREVLNLEETGERLEKASSQGVLVDLKALPNKVAQSGNAERHESIEALLAEFRKSIEDDTVTLEQVDSVLQHPAQIPSSLTQYLLGKKAWLLLRQGRGEAGLQYYDRALAIENESPSTWASKGMALLELERVDEAFRAFGNAYALRAYFGPQKAGYLQDLFWPWAATAFLRGLNGSLVQDASEFQKGVEEFLLVVDKAMEEGLEESLGKIVFREPSAEQPQGTSMVVHGELILFEPATPELRAALEETQLAIRLMSIKDPFEGWRELGKELSKVWPKGLSAVKAVREIRR